MKPQALRRDPKLINSSIRGALKYVAYISGFPDASYLFIFVGRSIASSLAVIVGQADIKMDNVV